MPLGRRRRSRDAPARAAVDLRALVERHLDAGRPTGWFEELYAGADRDPSAVPWGGDDPHPYLVDWLAEPVAVPPGRRAVVVGCGLGGDLAAVHAAGYDVLGFDVSPTAASWAAERAPAGTRVLVADLLELPDDLVGAFDLVVEVRTVQSLPGVVRDAAMHAVASLAADGGVVVAVTTLATSADATALPGPPWPQAPSELTTYLAGGLRRVALEHPDPAGAPTVEVRCTFVRDGSGDAGTFPGATTDVLGIDGRAGPASLPIS